MNQTRILAVSAALLLIFLGSSGCIFWPGPPDDGSFLEPIPEETLQAFQFDTTIETRLQAVIAARRGLETSTQVYSDMPQIVSVEKMKYARAISRVRKTASEDYPENLKVWLVVFLCEIDHVPSTPDQPSVSSQQCTFVIVNAQDGHTLLLGSNPDCKSLYEW